MRTVQCALSLLRVNVWRDEEEVEPGQEALAELPAVADDGKAPESSLPAVLGDYQLMHVAGRGGMGEVWQARHVVSRKPFAVKVLRPDLLVDETAAARFIQEARVMEALVHPNVLRVFHVGEQEGHSYFVMEWIEGGSLADLLEARGTLTLLEARDILWQMMDGLSHAYDRGLVHRDVKPGNVLMRNGRDVKITDFGIAKFLGADPRRTGTNQRLGSPWYMSPEQIQGGDVDHRTDIYSLGITFYQLLTGHVPFDGELISVLYRHVHDPLPVSFELEHLGNGAVLPILRKMTAKAAEDRYQTYDDVQFAITRLGAVVEGSGRLTPPAGIQGKAGSGVRPAADVPLGERLDTFHEIGTVPLDAKGGISLGGMETVRLGTNASTMDVLALDPIHPTRATPAPSKALAATLTRVREHAGYAVSDAISGGSSSVKIAALLMGLVALLIGGAVVVQKIFPGLMKGRETAKASTASASPAKALATPTASPSPTPPPMEPLQQASSQPLQPGVARETLSIQALGPALFGKDPAEITRLLGVPQFTQEAKLGGGMYYLASQWAPLLYDENSSRTLERVKVLFYNGKCVSVDGS